MLGASQRTHRPPVPKGPIDDPRFTLVVCSHAEWGSRLFRPQWPSLNLYVACFDFQAHKRGCQNLITVHASVVRSTVGPNP